MSTLTTSPPPALRIFTGPEVCRLTGVSYRQLDYWARSEYIPPTFPARGSGTQRRYSYPDLVAIHVVGQFRKMGLPLDRAKGIADAIRERCPDGVLPPDLFAVVTSRDCGVVDASEFEAVLAKGGWVMPLEPPALDEPSAVRPYRLEAVAV